jgi:hypothetical protein
VLTAFFMAVCGVGRVFHLEGFRDAGFAVLTGGRHVLSRHWLGGWIRHVRTRAARRFCRLTQKLRRFEGQTLRLSLDEHTVPRWTRRNRPSKGYVTTRNKHMRCEKLYYLYDVATERFLYILPTLGRIGLHQMTRSIVRAFRRETRLKGARLILDAGATLKDSEFRRILQEAKHTILARAPRRPHLLKRWKAIPAEQFTEHREPGEWKDAPDNRVFVAETRTALKDDGPDDPPIRTIVIKETRSSRGRPGRARWHVLYTGDEKTPTYELVKEFRTRQHHEQAYRVMVHDEALDAVTSGYNRKASNPNRPGFNHGPITVVAWIKALAFNALMAFTERLPKQLRHRHPRTLRRLFFTRPGRLWRTPKELIVQPDFFPEQVHIEHLVREINAKEYRIPWLMDRRLVIALSPDPRRRRVRKTAQEASVAMF